jgi:hypothetical protein
VKVAPVTAFGSVRLWDAAPNESAAAEHADTCAALDSMCPAHPISNS